MRIKVNVDAYVEVDDDVINQILKEVSDVDISNEYQSRGLEYQAHISDFSEYEIIEFLSDNGRDVVGGNISKAIEELYNAHTGMTELHRHQFLQILDDLYQSVLGRTI